MSDAEKWAFDEDRTYHGVDPDHSVGRIFVELSEFGWTERAHPLVLRELKPADPVVTFRWGYIGSGTNSAARAIITDAFGVEPKSWVWQAFTEDWLAHFPDEFRVRRAAVLRWARGLAAQRGISDLPGVLADLPPVDRGGYEYRPEHLRRRNRGGAG